MRILIYSAAFFPAKRCGGPPVSVDNFCTLMQKHMECYVVASDHDLGDNKRYENISDGWNDRGNAKVLYLSDSDFKSPKVIQEVIDEIEPDWIYFQSFFQTCVLPGLIVAKKNGNNVLLATRGEMCEAAINRKKYKKIPYIALMRLFGLINNVHFQSTSDDETEGIKKWLKVTPNRIHKLDNIPSIVNRSYQYNEKREGEAKFVFLSRIHPIKNLSLALEFLRHVKGQLVFDIYGPIEDAAYWSNCQSIINTLDNNAQVSYMGLASHDKVHEILSKYDALVFPTQSENFGHVIAESLAVGTPAIISDQTPWKDIDLYGAGRSISLNDTREFIKALQEIVYLDNEAMREKHEKAKSYFEAKMKIEELRLNYYNFFINNARFK